MACRLCRTFALIIAFSTFGYAHAEEVPSESTAFYQWLGSLIDKAFSKFGDTVVRVPKAIVLAISKKESNNGKRVSPRARYNLFGILHKDTGKPVDFASYEEATERLLWNFSNHRAYAKFRSKLDRESATKLADYLGSYAEDPDYVASIKKIILAENLEKYDRPSKEATPPMNAKTNPSEEDDFVIDPGLQLRIDEEIEV